MKLTTNYEIHFKLQKGNKVIFRPLHCKKSMFSFKCQCKCRAPLLFSGVISREYPTNTSNDGLLFWPFMSKTANKAAQPANDKPRIPRVACTGCLSKRQNTHKHIYNDKLIKMLSRILKEQICSCSC